MLIDTTSTNWPKEKVSDVHSVVGAGVEACHESFHVPRREQYG